MKVTPKSNKVTSKTLKKQKRHIAMLQLMIKSLKNVPTQPVNNHVSLVEPDIPSVNHYVNRRRAFTLTIVVPSSIIDNAQSLELKTYLVG